MRATLLLLLPLFFIESTHAQKPAAASSRWSIDVMAGPSVNKVQPGFNACRCRRRKAPSC